MDGIGERRLTFGPTAAPDGGDEHALHLGQGEDNQTRDNLTLSSILPAALVVLGQHGRKILGASSA